MVIGCIGKNKPVDSSNHGNLRADNFIRELRYLSESRMNRNLGGLNFNLKSNSKKCSCLMYLIMKTSKIA